MTRLHIALRSSVAGLALLGAAVTTLSAQGPPGPGSGDKKKPLPLEAARSADFTATRGTWMSLDVSPDGQTIVFDMLGDLYTLPIAGGTATRITEGLAYDGQPRFSPDGETIVFVSDRSGGDNVWTLRMDFTDTTQVTRGNTSLYYSPEWMPDGEHIVVSRTGGLGGSAKLRIYNVHRSSAEIVISGPASAKTMGAAVSPDGQHIWYARRSGDWQYNAIFPQYQLYRYDRETGTSTRMTGRYGSGFRPAISPDGRWLVFGTRDGTETGLRIRDLNTGAERWLAYPVQRDDMESRAPLDVLPGYSFMPDSRSVVVSYDGQIWRVPIDGGTAANIPFEAEVKLAIGPEVKFEYRVDTSATVTARQIRHPVASPNGEQIAFTAFDRLWVQQLDGGEPRRLTTADIGEYFPVWSPDGSTLAYVTWDDSAGGNIMSVRANGTSPRQLTSAAALYYDLAWSPDGQRIVASRGAARQLTSAPDVFFGPLGGEFVWVPASGGDVTLIAPTGSRDVAHFRVDQPNRIYAYSRSEGLVSFRWDGTDVKRHLNVRGARPPGGFGNPHPEQWEVVPGRVFPQPVLQPSVMDPEAAEQGPRPPPAGLVMMSPTGGRALAQVGNHIYMIDMPAVTVPVPTVSVARPSAAPVLVRQLTEVGGEFPSWSADGTQIRWSIGNALFTYDLSRVEAIEDSTQQAARETVGQALRARHLLDSLKTARGLADSLEKADSAVVPDSLTQRISQLAADSVQMRADSLIRAADELRARAAVIRARADSVRSGMDSLAADTAGYKPAEMRIDVELPREVVRGSIVLRGGRVVTMQGDSIIENADIVITDNRIVGVGTTGVVDVPEGAQIIDVTGKTITPGFVDTHYHPQWLVPEIHSEQAWQYLTTLAFGVTTTRDPQTGSTDVLSYQDRIDIGGMIGPRIYSTGPGVFLTENIRNAKHAKTVLRRYSQYYNTHTLKMYMSGNRQQRQWIIQAAKELKLMPTTEGGLDFRLNITHALDGYPGIEHALPITPIFNDVVELFKASQTTNTPTLLVSYGGPFGENFFYTTENVHDDPKLRRFAPEESIDARSRRRGGNPGRGGWFLPEEYVFQRHAEFVRAMLEDSARIGVGSHGQLQGLGYHWELWALGSGGLSPHNVLRAATIYGAEAIGLGTDLGTIEEGKLADILVFDADPLEDLRNSVRILYVMKGGRLYEGETLNEVWPRERPFVPPHWLRQGPEGVAAGIRR